MWKQKRIFVKFFLLFFVCFIFAGIPLQVQASTVKQVIVSGPEQIKLTMENGKLVKNKINLTVEVYFEDASKKGIEMIKKFESSDPSVATVDINGRVRGESPGVVTITAITKDGQAKGTHQISVVYEGTIIDDSGKEVYYEEGKKITDRFYEIDGKMYYITGDGTKAVSWYNIAGNRYYFDSNGLYVTGWNTIEAKKYYFGKDGIMLTGWQTINGNKYYFGKDGVMLTGWQTINGKRYRFRDDGVMLITGWQNIEGQRYYN